MSKSPIDATSNIDPKINPSAIQSSTIQDALGSKENKELNIDFLRNGCVTRAQIMDAASERFSHYGYGKTTIADISADCKMSAGNIYRYFESKVDIAAAISHDTGVQVMMDLQEKITKKTKARDKLRVFLFSSLRTTFRQLDAAPRLSEMIDSVRKHRPEVRRKIRRLERSLLTEILKYGRKTGEFRVDCVQSTARVIQCLVSRFRWPQLNVVRVQLSRLETELEGTLAMILSALGAGCLLGSIMRGHPKDKDGLHDDEKLPNENSPNGNLSGNLIEEKLVGEKTSH